MKNVRISLSVFLIQEIHHGLSLINLSFEIPSSDRDRAGSVSTDFPFEVGASLGPSEPAQGYPKPPHTCQW